MPQWRRLWAKTTESIDFNDMPDDFTRLLWAMLPLCLDREGRGIDNPSWVRSKIFPLRNDVSLEMVQTAMEWFAFRIDPETGLGMIIRYQVGNHACFFVPTFHEHQGDTNKEAASTLPAPPPDLLRTYSGHTPDLLQSKSLLEESRGEESKREESGTNSFASSDISEDPPEIVNYLNELLERLHLSKLDNRDQIDDLVRLRDAYGLERSLECATWLGAKPQMTARKAIRSMQTALAQGWSMAPPGGNNGHAPPARQFIGPNGEVRML